MQLNAHEVKWQRLDALTQKHPELKEHFVRYGGGQCESLFTTDAAKVLAQKGATEDLEELASICDQMGGEFKARIIRENILPKK